MLRLAFRSIFRHKVRTGLTLSIIVFGVMGILLSGGFVEDVFIQLREATIHSRLGHIQVYRDGYTTIGQRNPYQFLISKPRELAAAISESPHVLDVMARLNFTGLINNGRADLPIIGEGIEQEREMRMGSALSIVSGRGLTADDSYGIMLGKGVAAALRLEPGDSATLVVNTPEGAMNLLEFEVVGIFSTFARDYDNRAVRIPLSAAQELLDIPQVHSLVVMLDATELADAVAADLKRTLANNQGEQYEVKVWHELADFYRRMVDHYQVQFDVIQLIILVMVLLSVVNSVNMAIYERVGEFGTLKAMGDRNRDVFWQIIKENLLLGMLGASLGVVLGVLSALVLSGIGIEMPPPPNSDTGYIAYIRLVPRVIVIAFITGVSATMLAALLPAYRVSRRPVAEALRENI